MKKLLLFGILAAMGSFAQTVPGDSTVKFNGSVDASTATSSTPIPLVTSLPLTCSVGNQVFLTTATAGANLYGCTATNTWTAQGAAGTGVSSFDGRTGAVLPATNDYTCAQVLNCPSLPSASAQSQYLRIQPNTGSTSVYQFSSLPFLNANDYNFPPQTPGGTLTAGTPATITLTPVPNGVSGANGAAWLEITGGTGTAEQVKITGGTATSGASSGTVTFTPANSHSGAWAVSSATAGVQECINAPIGPHACWIPRGYYTWYAPVIYNNQPGTTQAISYAGGQVNGQGNIMGIVGEDPNTTFINVDSSFPMTAPGVIYMPGHPDTICSAGIGGGYFAPNNTPCVSGLVANLTMYQPQPNVSTKAGLTQWPPMIKMAGTYNFGNIIDNMYMEGCWDCIDTHGTDVGWLRVNRIRMETFDKGIWIDGTQARVIINDFDVSYIYGYPDNPSNIFTTPGGAADAATIFGLYIGRLDDLEATNIGVLGASCANFYYGTSGAAHGFAFGQISHMDCDTTMGMTMTSGDLRCTGCFFSMDGRTSAMAINQNGTTTGNSILQCTDCRVNSFGGSTTIPITVSSSGGPVNFHLNGANIDTNGTDVTSISLTGNSTYTLNAVASDIIFRKNAGNAYVNVPMVVTQVQGAVSNVSITNPPTNGASWINVGGNSGTNADFFVTGSQPQGWIQQLNFKWVALSLLNGWTSGASLGYQSPAAWRDGEGIVHLRGVLQQGTDSYGTNIAQLPGNTWPFGALKVAVPNNVSGTTPNLCYVDILPTGYMNLSSSGCGSSYISLDGITFIGGN